MATQEVEDYVGQKAIKEIVLDLFPVAHESRFVYYDDDGTSYAYEQGMYYRQEISVEEIANKVHIKIAAPTGSYHPVLNNYLLRVHGKTARQVWVNGRRSKRNSHSQGGTATTIGEWQSAEDQFGVATTIRIASNAASAVTVQ